MALSRFSSSALLPLFWEGSCTKKDPLLEDLAVLPGRSSHWPISFGCCHRAVKIGAEAPAWPVWDGLTGKLDEFSIFLRTQADLREIVNFFVWLTFSFKFGNPTTKPTKKLKAKETDGWEPPNDVCFVSRIVRGTLNQPATKRAPSKHKEAQSHMFGIPMVSFWHGASVDIKAAPNGKGDLKSA